MNGTYIAVVWPHRYDTLLDHFTHTVNNSGNTACYVTTVVVVVVVVVVH